MNTTYARNSMLRYRRREASRLLSSTNRPGFVRGERIDMAVDWRALRTGDTLDIPYELTVGEGLVDFWQSAFFGQDRINSSVKFARRIGLQDRTLPFGLVLLLASSMSHADAAKIQTGFKRVEYLWPAFCGDTFRRSFRVQSVRNTSDQRHSIITFVCDLINQRNRICMRAYKSMLFDETVQHPPTSILEVPPVQPELREHILKQSHNLEDLGSQSLARLREGQLIFHSLQRSLTFTQSQQLASLARLTHDKHFHTSKYDRATQILAPGGLVLGLALSATSRDLHEVLHEDLAQVNFVNSLNPGSLVGAVTYVQKIEENLPGDLELIHLRTIGIKDLDVPQALTDLPQELFEPTMLFPREVEVLCNVKCPVLAKKIVVQADRRIIRMACRPDSLFLL